MIDERELWQRAVGRFPPPQDAFERLRRRRERKRRNQRIVAIGVAAVIAVLGFAGLLRVLRPPPPQPAAPVVERVVAGPDRQYRPSSDGSTVAYLSYLHGNSAVVFDVATGKITPIDPGARATFVGSFIAGTDQLVYQRGGARSHAYIYDVSSGLRAEMSNLVTGDGEQSVPAASRSFLLYIRDYPTRADLVLFDRTTGRKQILATDVRANPRRFLTPAFVGTTYAAWTDCAGDDCHVRYLDIATGARRSIPDDGGAQYGTTIDEAAGQIYYVRSEQGVCGHHVEIRRAPLTAPASSEEVLALPPGVDTDTWLSLGPNPNTGKLDLFFSRARCDTGTVQVNAVRGVAP